MASTSRDEITRLELLHAAHPDGLVFPHLADAYRRVGRYDQAETILDDGLRRHADYSSAHVVVGRLRFDQGRHVEAERAFRRVLELDPQNQVAMEYLGRIALEAERFEDALHQFRGLARVKPSREIRDRVRDLTESVARARRQRSDGNGRDPHVRPRGTSGNGGGNGNGRVQPEGATIRQHLAALLAWQPSAPSAGPSVDGESGVAEVVAPEPEWNEPEWVEPGRAERGALDAGAGVPPVEASVAAGQAGGPGREAGGDAPASALSLIAITDMLVGLLEYRDPFFRGSSSLTRLVAEKVAEEMGLGERERVDLALAAVLRDLGRLAMGGRLVSQPAQPGEETQESRREIERHVDLALHLLEGIELPRDVRHAVRHHHERWDGAGYPDRLAGESIPLLARILAVVDSFAAMVSPRPYRLPRKMPEAARELREAAGTQYDPTVVEALMRVLARKDQPHLGFAQRPHLLLVSPDQPGAVVTATRLCSAGFVAEVSPDPDTARERLRRVPVAALILSTETGEEGAPAFVRELRADPLFSSLPVVVVDAGSVALRVRLLESGADVCFPPGTRYAELQGTLAALVGRTLRADQRKGGTGGATGSAEAPWLALQGDIEDFPLTWLLQVMKYDSRTAAIGIRGAAADGAIYLENGDAIHAQIRGGAKGEAALRRMLQWETGRFIVQPAARPRERTIEASIMHLLLTQAVDEDHSARGIFGAVTDKA